MPTSHPPQSSQDGRRCPSGRVTRIPTPPSGSGTGAPSADGRLPPCPSPDDRRMTVLLARSMPHPKSKLTFTPGKQASLLAPPTLRLLALAQLSGEENLCFDQCLRRSGEKRSRRVESNRQFDSGLNGSRQHPAMGLGTGAPSADGRLPPCPSPDDRRDPYTGWRVSLPPSPGKGCSGALGTAPF